MASSVSWLQEHDTSHGSSKLQVTILASVWGSSKVGLSTINTELAIQLAKFSNVEITFFLPKCSDEDKKAANRHGVSIVEAVRRPGYNELEWLSFPPEDLRIDVVVGHGVKLGRQAQVIRDSHKCKWVQVVHTNPEELGMFKCYENPFSMGGEKHGIELELCNMADFVVGVGPKLAEALHAYLGFSKKHQDIFEFTPGIFDDFSSVQQIPFEGIRCRVLVFGHGDAEDFKLKGFDIAARSVAALPDTVLVFVGAPEKKHHEIAKLFFDFGIPMNRLRVRGGYHSLETLKRLFHEVDLVLMPSRTEGFGLTGLEALSAGLPVLVSKNTGFGEALLSVPLSSEYVIDSEDPSTWTAAIKCIWNRDRKARLKEIKDLRESYAKRYSWSEQCKHLIEKMFQLLNGTGSSVPAEIRRRGARAERAFQRAMQTGREVKVHRGRIMLLGQDRAGKTSLRKSLLGLPFDPEQESTVGVEVDEVEKWMPVERKKGEDNIARFIFRGLRNDSTAADPNIEEVKTTDQLEEKKDHKEPKLSPDGDELGTEEMEVGHKALSEENLVDKNELSNELQLNINLNFTELAARYSQSRPEDDIKSEEVILSLWDFAGQHLYYASHSVFLSGRAVYILVYNLNKNLLATAEPCVRQGLSDIRLDNPNHETNLDNLLSWLVSVHNIRSAANEKVPHQQTKLPYQRPPVIIVGTNLDQPFEELATTEKRIKDSIIDKEYVKHVITTFFAVDNSTENDEGVQKLRDKIMEVLEGEPYMPEEVPLRVLCT